VFTPPPDPTFPRYSTRPFPAYRFVPGRSPHPRTDSRGHSYGKPEPGLADEALALHRDWRASPRFRFSVDLYNHAYWWEAHEGWEGLWRHLESADPLRYALQALIQVSVAHLQRVLDREDGMSSLLKLARLNLDAARPAGAVVLGCDLQGWWQDAVSPYFADPHAAGYPFLRPA
jgi:hypothetical protein